jgi:2Fe-2S ferredoxin
MERLVRIGQGLRRRAPARLPAIHARPDAARPHLARVPCRAFAADGPSSGGPPPPTDPNEAEAFALVVAAGHRPAIAAGVLAALSESRLSGAPMLGVVRGLIGRPEVGLDGGLEPLVASIEQQLAQTEGRARVRFSVFSASSAEDWTSPDGGSRGSRFEVEAFEGMSISDVARHGTGPGAELLAETLECACSGIMACSTCHLIVAPQWYERVGPPEEAELDMLELAYEPEPTSRLGCQIVLRPELDGLRVRLPRRVTDVCHGSLSARAL